LKFHFPIHKLFERGCELGLWRLGADKIATIFGTRLNRRMRGNLATVIDQIEHGHHLFRAYFKSGFLKQYGKFSTFLRNELVSNNLNDFGLRKGSIISTPPARPSRRSPTASPPSRRNGSTAMSTFPSWRARHHSALIFRPAASWRPRIISACLAFESPFAGHSI
jgi:hypothetical protein